MGDIEAGRRKMQERPTKNTPGDNKMLCLGEGKKRQTEARNADGIMGGKDGGRL